MTSSKTEKKLKIPGEAGKTAIQVVERMMNLLDALAVHEDSTSLKSLAVETDLHPSTAHRILNDLVACRLVERGDGGTYRLGLKLSLVILLKLAYLFERLLKPQCVHCIN